METNRVLHICVGNPGSKSSESSIPQDNSSISSYSQIGGRDLHDLSRFPNLKRVDLNYMAFRNMGCHRYPGVEELRILDCDFSEINMEFIREVFPGLKRLRIDSSGLNTKVINSLDLEELSISTKEEVDLSFLQNSKLKILDIYGVRKFLNLDVISSCQSLETFKAPRYVCRDQMREKFPHLEKSAFDW